MAGGFALVGVGLVTNKEEKQEGAHFLKEILNENLERTKETKR